MLRFKTLAALGAAAMILATGAVPAAAAVSCSASSPCINIKNTSVVEPDGAIPRPAEFEVTLSHASPLPITVWFVTSNGTAQGSIDYLSWPNSSMSFEAGTTRGVVLVSVRGDTTQEPDETFFVLLENATGGAQIVDGFAQATIVDNDRPLVSISNASVSEGDGESKFLRFNVTLSKVPAQTVSVQYTTANGSATSGADYAPRSSSLTFAAGTSVLTQQVSVPVLGDLSIEPDETVILKATSISGARAGDTQGLGTILDDDTFECPPQIPNCQPE